MEERTRILWITNMMPGFVAKRLGLNGTNKEGWIEGSAERLCKDSTIRLMIAFPYADNGRILCQEDDIELYGFKEDTSSPEIYRNELENELSLLLDEARPDVIHVFGTEFPHTLALMKLEKWNNITMIHIQGIMEECYKVYAGNIPEYVKKRKTFRDIIRKDGIMDQIHKYELRAQNEHEALIRAKHVLGRTDFDRDYIAKLNKNCIYHRVNETLRHSFYGKDWEIEKCNRHELFLSQGNYPLKGAHVAIEALSRLKDKYEDIRLYIAGDRITALSTIKDRIKLPSYGKYLLELIKKNGLEENVVFTGALNVNEMLNRYLSAEVFILTSFVENSPNSLGEAMLLGMPSVCSKVGGVTSMANDGEEALLYEAGDAKSLAENIDKLFCDDELKCKIGNAAKIRAQITHNIEDNEEALLDAYKSVAERI